jgi:hypothetical protein
MSMSKENLSHHFDTYIINEQCCLVDYALSDLPSINKDKNIREMAERIERLKGLRNQLKEV